MFTDASATRKSLYSDVRTGCLVFEDRRLTCKRSNSVLRQRSSQLQKHKAARMSRRIAVDQNACGGDGGHPGLTV